jgi:tripartite-type tricarboxylate transporter receptor subunit TctC
MGIIRLSFAALLMTVVVTSAAQSQDYPARNVQVIVPFAGGSASDVVTRVLLEKMGASIGRRFIVENRPGAGGNAGTAVGAKAVPDGYTIIMSTVGPLASNKTLVKELGYDPEKDFEPIALFALLPNVIVISAKLPPKTLTEMIAYAKERPKVLNYGTVGVGSSQHLAGAFFEQLVGVQLTHVPYRNIAQYVPDLIAGTVPLGFQLLPNVQATLQSGQARALAVSGRTRMPALPNVPTVGEFGINGYESSAWLALVAPKGTPKPIVDKLNKELVAAMSDPQIRQRFADLGAEPVTSTPEELGKFITAEVAKWREIIARGNITIER